MSEDIKKILLLFRSVDPFFDVEEKAGQAIIELFIEKLGNDKATQIIKYALKIQGNKYAPVITSPAQLKNKFGQLLVYAKKQQNNRPKII